MIKFENVSKKIGKNIILDDKNIEFHTGCI